MLKHSHDIIRNGVLFQDIFFLLIPLFGAISLNSGGFFFNFFLFLKRGLLIERGLRLPYMGIQM